MNTPAAVAFEDLLFCRRDGYGRDRASRAPAACLDLAALGEDAHAVVRDRGGGLIPEQARVLIGRGNATS